MSIQASEMIWRYPTNPNGPAGDGTIGGRMTKNVIPTAVKNNIWPDIPQSERVSGSTRYRKAFVHISNDDDLELVRPRVFVETPSPGEDAVVIFPGTFTDVASAVTGSEDVYGAGYLNMDVSDTATEIEVMVSDRDADGTLSIFRAGDTIRISDRATVSDSGNEEYHVIAAGGVSYAGDVATLTLETALANSYTVASNTRVASVYEATDPLAGAYSSFTVNTAGSGDFDDTTYPVLLDHIGTIYQTWTLEFTSSSEFTITGDILGQVSSGNIGATVQPMNTDFNKPYFIMNNAGFNGAFTHTPTPDTITFTTSPCAIPIWYKRIIPVNANSLSGDKVIIGIDGESA